MIHCNTITTGKIIYSLVVGETLQIRIVAAFRIRERGRGARQVTCLQRTSLLTFVFVLKDKHMGVASNMLNKVCTTEVI